MWPFSKNPDPGNTPSVAKRLDDMELSIIELRETQEKTLNAIKRVQGRLLARLGAAEKELDTPEGAGEPNADQQVLNLAGDMKAQLRHRANQLRAHR